MCLPVVVYISAYVSQNASSQQGCWVYLSVPLSLIMPVVNNNAGTSPSFQLPVGCRYCPTGVDRSIISISASENIMSKGAKVPSIITARCQQHTMTNSQHAISNTEQSLSRRNTTSNIHQHNITCQCTPTLSNDSRMSVAPNAARCQR